MKRLSLNCILFIPFCSFQLFDYCLAPDTGGDGTGCDNMTAVIVRFKAADGTDSVNGVSKSTTEVKAESTTDQDSEQKPQAAKRKESDEATSEAAATSEAENPPSKKPKLEEEAAAAPTTSESS